MGWNKWIHESLEVGSPPLRKCVTNFPFVIDTFSRELGTDWGEAFVKSSLETVDLVVFWL
jgi:hypothetical protein